MTSYFFLLETFSKDLFQMLVQFYQQLCKGTIEVLGWTLSYRGYTGQIQ